MPKVSTNVSIDADIKAKAQAILSDFGMDLSTAINIFLRQMIYENAIPFEIQRNTPNAETAAALEEAREIAKNPELYKHYSSFAELLDEVKTDA